MFEFMIGIASSLATVVIIAIVTNWAWPAYLNNAYKGIRIAGDWEISELHNGKMVKSGKITLKQKGRNITGSSVRTRTRDGKKSERKFKYRGFTCGRQLTLTFEDAKGEGFDTGAYVFTVLNNAKEMEGMATFHGKVENKLVSESRILTKVVI